MAKKALKTLRQAQGFYPEPSRRIKRGLLITFEGPEGCGKTTHARLLFKYLKKCSYDCIYTREPGGTRTGEKIRDILLHSEGIDISDMTELFLFEAARAQIVREVIAPALTEKRIVICDRFSDATRSYQGYAAGLALPDIDAVDKVATGGLKPDATILLDIDTVTGLRRAGRKGADRIEKKHFAYHRRVRNGYLKLAKIYPGRIRVIKVSGTILETQKAVRQEVELVIKRYKRPA